MPIEWARIAVCQSAAAASAKGTRNGTGRFSRRDAGVSSTILRRMRMPRGAHGCGVSAQPRPPRRAPAGPTSPPLRGVPASEAAPPTGGHVRNHRPRGARAASVAKKMCHSGFVGHKLPRRPVRARIAASIISQGDPRHPLPDRRNRGAERPGFRAVAPATAEGRKKGLQP